MTLSLAIVMLLTFLALIGLCVWIAFISKESGAAKATEAADGAQVAQSNTNVALQEEYQDEAAKSDTEVLSGLSSDTF